jgi:hypothetical protein
MDYENVMRQLKQLKSQLGDIVNSAKLSDYSAVKSIEKKET